MIVTSTQEFALVAAGCCPCDLPACEAPRKQCQSITVDACGETLPDFEGVTAEQRCIIFKKIESRQYTIFVFTNSPIGIGRKYNGTVNQEFKCARTYAFKTESDERVCYDYNYATLLEVGDATESFITPPAEGSDVFNTHNYTISGEGTSETWTGTDTYIYTFPASGDPDDSGTIPYGYPGCTEIGITEDFTYADFVFTKAHDPFVTIYTQTVPNPEDDPENPDDDTIEEEVGRDTATLSETVTYSLPVELADLTAEIDAVKALLGTDDWPDTACQSGAVYNYGYPDPELDEEGEPIPPDPESLPAEPVCTQISSATRARYRMGIPASSRWDAVTAAWTAWDKEDPETRGEEPLKTTFDEAHAEWVIEKAAWDIADPETRGPEPIEPTKRTFFEIQWDEVFFPAAWDAWKALKNDYDLAVAAHEAWEAADPETRGPEPTIPEDPGAAPTPAPSLTASRSWSYAGGSDFSAWYEIEIPAIEGETRIVNVLTKCYRSARLGSLPTAHGEIYELPA